MSVSYTDFSYFYPPKAEAKIPVGLLDLYEKKGWWAQIKKNGTNSVIFVPPDREPFAYNRHGEKHKVWNFDDLSARCFKNLPGTGWYVFNAELLHSKVKGGPRNTNYVHDVLVCDGQYLIGSTYASRYELLREFFQSYIHDETESHFVLDPHTWLARNRYHAFKALYTGLNQAEDEGLVLKNPSGRFSTTDSKGAGWMAKIRKPNRNLGF